MRFFVLLNPTREETISLWESFLPYFFKEEAMEQQYPEIDGESAWLTQSIHMYHEMRSYLCAPIKMVLVGVPASLVSVTAAIALGKRVDCSRSDVPVLSFEKMSNTSHFRISRMPIPGSPYAVSVLTCTEYINDIAPASAVESVLLRKIKQEMGLPCLPEWCGHIRDILGRQYVRPMETFNVPEPMFYVRPPSTSAYFMNEFLMNNLKPLKEIAERRLP
jgi:hypothetical protein